MHLPHEIVEGEFRPCNVERACKMVLEGVSALVEANSTASCCLSASCDSSTLAHELVRGEDAYIRDANIVASTMVIDPE
jgi:hypothetical protein